MKKQIRKEEHNKPLFMIIADIVTTATTIKGLIIHKYRYLNICIHINTHKHLYTLMSYMKTAVPGTPQLKAGIV